MMEKLWYGKHPLRWCLWPFSLIYALVAKTRRILMPRFCQKSTGTPLVIVGNITVGGVGKTPLVIALAEKMKARGLRVGVVSRGYGASDNRFPYAVKANDDPARVGDEPLLIAQKTGCPVVIARKRSEAVAFLEREYSVQIIISDDGLQHYAMGRTLEIAVIDGLRGLGNGLHLPAGPLREGRSRLKTVDFIIVNEGKWPDAWPMSLKPLTFRQLTTGKDVTAEALTGNMAAVAAIGNPQRFFNSLTAMGLPFTPYVFPDHYAFKSQDLDFQESILVMTEKDAVKCRSLARDNMYALVVEALLTEGFWDAFWSHKKLRGVFQYVQE